MLSKADLYFMYRNNEKGICMMSIYVDGNFLVGHEEVLHEAIDQIESTFNIKIQTEITRKVGWPTTVIKSLLKKLRHLTEKV